MTGTPKKGEVRAGNRGKGRPKGALNKTTTLLKDSILEAARAAGGGGEEGLVAYLTMQASENPGPFMSLLGKVLPMQVSGPDGGPIQTENVGAAADKLTAFLDAIASRAPSEPS